MVLLCTGWVVRTGMRGVWMCVPGAPSPCREAGEPDTEPTGGDVGLGSQPPCQEDKLPDPSTTACQHGDWQWYAARLGLVPHSLTATQAVLPRGLGQASHGLGRTLGRWRGPKAHRVLQVAALQPA